MKKRGHKHSPGEKHLLAQVSDVFSSKIATMGAKTASKQLGVCVASIYNYAAGTDLPRMEVLQKAQERWNVKWEHLDPSEILRTRKLSSAEQLSLPLNSVRAKDVQVVSVEPKKSNILQVTVNIRFSA